MNKLATHTVALLAGILVLRTGVARATDISGTISTTTLTIMENSQLVGDVTCTVSGAPCIQFGAANITLNLNGFTMTGQGEPGSCPSDTPLENGISTNSEDGVSILGPGIVRRFRRNGILVSGSNSEVSHLVVASTCENGIKVMGSGNQVVANSVVRASLAGKSFNGIAVLGTGGHSILKNEVEGASDLAAQSGSRSGHGIFVSSNGNLIQDNNASGNPGVGIFLGNGATGNTIRRNAALGNLIFQDIFDNNTSGANAYQNNLCDTSGGADAPTCPNAANLAGH